MQQFNTIVRHRLLPALLLGALLGLPLLALVLWLLTALGRSGADFAAQLRPLAQALVAGALSDVQQAAALRILEAWYLGVVDGNVVTYEQALMYGVVSDTLVIRTYCPNQPGFWAEPPVERQV